MDRVHQWLKTLGLEQYAGLFAENRIGIDVLPDLTEQDLEKLQIPLGDRKRLLRGLAELRAPAPIASAEESRVSAGLERRPVTVLFCDISNYTRLTSELGAEITHRLAQRFHESAANVIREFGGGIERYIGDAVMGVFGVPVAHGNDPERALRAAESIHRVMTALSIEFGLPLSVHIGAAFGQVVASRRNASSGEFSTVGDTVNLAARLVGLARDGETVLSDSLKRELSDSIVAEPIGEVSVKGFEHPVAVWRMSGWSDRGRDRRRLPFVGRRAEVHQFEAACAACLDTSAGQVVYVRGDAGIGKTRLTEELELVASRLQFSVHKGLVLDFGVARADDAITQIVASVLGCEPGADGEARARALQVAAGNGLVEEDDLVFACDLLGIPQPSALNAVYDAMDDATRTRGRRNFILTLIRRQSTRAGLVLIVEDIHWADPASLDILAQLAGMTASHRVVLLLTSRVVGDPVDRGWRMRAGAAVGFLMIDLRPLRETEAIELARTLGASSRDQAAQCVARAEGNPLFLEQLLRASQMQEGESLPGSIQSLVLSRLDRLPPRDQRAIRAASVLGQRFSLALLRHLLGDDAYDCDALLAENLVQRMGEEFLFAHALIWESTYLSLVSDDKRRWHMATAEWYSARDPALAAEHLDRAGDPRAATAYLEAARAERQLYRTDRALRLLDRGLELTRDRVEQFRLLAERGELLPDLGRAVEAIDDLEQALSLAGDDRERCRALIGIAAAMREADPDERVFALLDQAQALTQQPGFELEAAQIHYLRGSLYFPLGKFDGCMAEQQCALEHARHAGSPEWEARALSGLGDACFAACKPASAYRYFEECVERSRKHGLGKVEVANLAMAGIIAALFLGKLDEALAVSEHAEQLAAKVGQIRAQIVALHSCAGVWLEKGQPSQARVFAQKATDLARDIGAKRFVPEGMLLVALCDDLEGRADDATRLLREAYVLCQDVVTYCGPWVLGALSAITNDERERERCLSEGQRILEMGCPSHNHAYFYRHAIDGSLQKGERDRAEELAGRLEQSFSSEPVPVVTFTIERARALIAVGRGQRDRALLDLLMKLEDQARTSGATVWIPSFSQAAEAVQANLSPQRMEARHAQ